MVSITVYDGSLTIGGNKIYVEDRGRGVFLDFGTNFAKYNMFFQEFLTERRSRGIHDLIYLGLIPKLNIYRRDLIPSDVDLSPYPKLNIEAVLLSHAHLDHCGNIALLEKNIPIVASNTTVAILKALRDLEVSPKVSSEIFYGTNMERVEGTDGMVLRSSTNKAYEARDFYCTTEPTRELMEFCSSRPGQESHDTKKVISGKLGSLYGFKLPFIVEPYDVDHSIYGAKAFILRGETTIAYTGDFRLHGRSAEKTDRFIDAARNASILITEGTRVGRNLQPELEPSEEQVFDNCKAIVEETDGLTVADFSSRNFERLEMFLRIARELNKMLVISAKDAYLLYAIGCAEGACIMDSEEIAIYEEVKKKFGVKWETGIVRARWGDRYIGSKQIGRDPSRYILCFSFFDLKHLLDIMPQKGSYIYSSSEAFSEEQSFDFVRLGHWLDFFNLKTFGFKIDRVKGNPYPRFTKGFHASGHASEEDIIKVIERIDPDKIIPIHTEKPEWFKENFDNVIIPCEGESLLL
ncbi:MAG: MBL fold metallo-hydrolase RNA specificity domain-containing protein [Nitrososphaeria archaeon]